MSEGPSSYDHFIDEHAASLGRLAHVLCASRPDAEDLLQESLLLIYRKWDQVGRADSVRSYARRILINEFLKNARRRRLIFIPLGSNSRVIESSEAEIDAHDSVSRLLAGLGARQQAVLALRYLDDRSDEEIARIMRCRRATVRSLAKRGLDRLRAQLDQSDRLEKGRT